jgi:hypothetical protein
MKLYREASVMTALLLGLGLGLVFAPGAFARGSHGGHSGGHSGSHASYTSSSGGHGGHFSHGFHPRVFAGVALFAPFYFYPLLPPYFYPAPTSLPAEFWYFCPSANTYYPYVTECPEVWREVVPQPQS